VAAPCDPIILSLISRSPSYAESYGQGSCLSPLDTHTAAQPQHAGRLASSGVVQKDPRIGPVQYIQRSSLYRHVTLTDAKIHLTGSWFRYQEDGMFARNRRALFGHCATSFRALGGRHLGSALQPHGLSAQDLIPHVARRA